MTLQKGRNRENSLFENIKLACTSGVCIVVLVAALAIPISMVVMGSIYLHDCPAERYIPIYLIVFGVFSSIVTVLRMITDCCKSESKKTSVVMVIIYVIMVITGPFITAWYIAGNVWIYRLKDKYSTVPTDANYCNNTLYLYAFWITTSLYILGGVVLLVLMVAGCVVLLKKLSS